MLQNRKARARVKRLSRAARALSPPFTLSLSLYTLHLLRCTLSPPPPDVCYAVTQHASRLSRQWKSASEVAGAAAAAAAGSLARRNKSEEKHVNHSPGREEPVYIFSPLIRPLYFYFRRASLTRNIAALVVRYYFSDLRYFAGEKSSSHTLLLIHAYFLFTST